MDQYLEKLEVFYDEKMKYLTRRNKYIRCKGCETEKAFQEDKDEIILSCGSGKTDKCGPQIIIKLPKYIHYENSIDELKQSLNEEYNWDVLQKFLDVSDKAKESEEKQKKINEEIARIEKLFFEKNMALKQEQLQKFYDQRIQKTKQCRDIMKKLKTEGKNEGEMRKYISLVQEINKDYEQIQELMKDMNPFLMEQEPEVIIQNEDYEYKKIESLDESQLIEKIFNMFIENDGIITRKDYMDMKEEGGFNTEWGSTLFSSLQQTKNHPWKKKEQEKYGSIIIQPNSTDPDQIECSKKWMEYLTTNQYKAGMKVSWMYKDQKKLGTIKELKGKGALVEDEKGKQRIRALKGLTIEEN